MTPRKPLGAPRFFPVGILDTAADLFRFSRNNGVQLTSAGTGIASSFTNTLSTVVGPSVGISEASEAQALQVPPVARATQLYTTAAQKMVLKDPSGKSPAWLGVDGTAVTPGGQIASAVLSLIFHGKCIHWAQRDAAGEVLGITQLPALYFGMDMFGQVTLKNQVLPNQKDFIFTRGPLGQGFLDFGKDAIQHYLGLRDSILSRSRNPIPVVELKVTDAFVTADEIKKAQTDWQAARSATNGAVAFTPNGIDVNIHGDKADTSMLSEARNEVRKDVANFLNLNSSLLDGNSGQSDTYSNTLQDKDEFVDLSLDTFLVPLEQRFSQSDVSPVPLVFDRDVFRRAVTPAAVGNTGTATTAPTQEGN